MCYSLDINAFNIVYVVWCK